MFLTKRTRVESLEAGAKEYGGATRLEDGTVYSYTKTALEIPVRILNDITIYIPAEVVGAEEWAINYILNNKNFIGVQIPKQVKGSWYSKEQNSVIVEDITLLRFFISCDYLTEVITFAEELKEEAKQEAISFEVNNEYMVIV